MAFDFSSLFSALIGAGAALAGTAINQRSERVKAHEDRIWKERSTSYVAMYTWCRVIKGSQVAYKAMASWGPGDPKVEKRLNPTTPGNEVVTNFRMYASNEAVKAFDATYAAFMDWRHVILMERAKEGDVDYEYVVEQFEKVAEQIERLEKVMMRETRGGRH